MSRAELFVFIALAVGWTGVAAWALRIGRKLSRLDQGSQAPGDSAPSRSMD